MIGDWDLGLGRDWGFGLRIWIGDWDWGLGLMIGIVEWDRGLGLGIGMGGGIGDWNLGL